MSFIQWCTAQATAPFLVFGVCSVHVGLLHVFRQGPGCRAEDPDGSGLFGHHKGRWVLQRRPQLVPQVRFLNRRNVCVSSLFVGKTKEVLFRC